MLSEIITAVHEAVYRRDAVKTFYPRIKPFFACDCCGKDKPRLGNRAVYLRKRYCLIGWVCRDCQRKYTVEHVRSVILGLDGHPKD
jgi:hypothetical protein